ncbi:MAG: hypothetical protein LAO21_12040 [Acidobacteriia bacterium]|nr:hypothetical protein [Terriglobia bacterium]
MTFKFIKPFTAKFKAKTGNSSRTLLWGEAVEVLDQSGDPIQVKVWGEEGSIAAADLTDRSLLEVYVIDVGQGDGILIKTPEGKWHLVDAGAAHLNQMTYKGTANFLRWKFLTALGLSKVSLANVIVTHPDADHFGGMIDVFSGKLIGKDPFVVEVENFYHCGMGRFKEKPELGERVSGEVAPFPKGNHGIKPAGSFITELLEDKNSFSNPPRQLAKEFAEYAGWVSKVPGTVRRLSGLDGYLPGYTPADRNEVNIRILGPVLEQIIGGKPGLRWLGDESVTRNGHSIVLRLDFGQARILLTGDLNEVSQRLLLSYYPEEEFTVDVAKGCHHGSEEVDWDFVKAMKARATVISSGDNETFSHPRPVILGASAHYGRESKGADGKLLPPLVYSTELARSVNLAFAKSVEVNLDASPGGTPPSPQKVKPEDTILKLSEKESKERDLKNTPVAAGLVYGLVNIRTDGQHILCATLKESGNDFDVKVFKAGVSP